MSDTDAVTADDLRALSAAATPGPWYRAGSGGSLLSEATKAPVNPSYGGRAADAELVVWLRNHADALADLIDAAGALVQPAGWWTGVEQRQEHQLLDRRAVVRDALDALDADA